jgi:hypothetical protein
VDGTRSALIVASDAYQDPGLRQLRAPASDAQALAAVLEHPEIGGFQVRTLLNQPAHEVSLAVEEFFADRRPDDLLLVHVSSHGVKDEDGELYFAATNTRLRRLGATAVAAEFVNRRMSRTRSRRVVLLLDCCYAGAFERGMTARAGTGVGIKEQFGGRGRAVITASSAMEYAFEGDELADASRATPSVFTRALVEGLETGEADRDQDGLVALDELYDYVYDKVRAVTPNQTPGKWTFGVQGDLYIARRARPVTQPVPLPAELQEAVDSPFAGVRAGIVPELARLLRSRHAGLALSARLTLERLTGDDSRAVSAAATTAIQKAEDFAREEAPAREEGPAREEATGREATARTEQEKTPKSESAVNASSITDGANNKQGTASTDSSPRTRRVAAAPYAPVRKKAVLPPLHRQSSGKAHTSRFSKKLKIFVGIGVTLVVALVVLYAYRASLDDHRITDREIGLFVRFEVQSPWHLSVDTSETSETCRAWLNDKVFREIIKYSSTEDFQIRVEQPGTFNPYVSGVGCKFAVIGPDGNQIPMTKV